MLHYPQVAGELQVPEGLLDLAQPGIGLFAEMLDYCRRSPEVRMASVLERFRTHSDGQHLVALATREVHVAENVAREELEDCLRRVLAEARERESAELIEKAASSGLSADEKEQLRKQLRSMNTPAQEP